MDDAQRATMDATGQGARRVWHAWRHGGSAILVLGSSDAAPLEANKSYNPFALYAAFYHSGDYKAAATQALAADRRHTARAETFGPLAPEVVASIEGSMVAKAMKKENDSWRNVESEIDEANATIEIAGVALSAKDEFFAALNRAGCIDGRKPCGDEVAERRTPCLYCRKSRWWAIARF